MTHPLLDRARAAALDLFRSMIFRRARSYRAVFMPEGAIGRDHEIVLADLRTFCRAATTTYTGDRDQALILEGRRQAWLRISQHLNLDEATVQKLVEIDDGTE